MNLTNGNYCMRSENRTHTCLCGHFLRVLKPPS